MHRPTWAEVDLGAIRHNIKSITHLVGKNTAIMAVVKANAYGHGMAEVSRVLESEKVAYLGVATLDEALILRREKITLPILILGSVLPEEAEESVKNNVTLTLCNKELLDELNKLTGKGCKPKVHIKIDTGMGRIGVWHEEAIEFINRVRQNPEIEMRCWRFGKR